MKGEGTHDSSRSLSVNTIAYLGAVHDEVLAPRHDFVVAVHRRKAGCDFPGLGSVDDIGTGREVADQPRKGVRDGRLKRRLTSSDQRGQCLQRRLHHLRDAKRPNSILNTHTRTYTNRNTAPNTHTQTHKHPITHNARATSLTHYIHCTLPSHNHCVRLCPQRKPARTRWFLSPSRSFRTCLMASVWLTTSARRLTSPTASARADSAFTRALQSDA